MGTSWAMDRGINFIEHLPQWEKYGPRAGAVRNQKVVDLVDRLFVFNHGDELTSGTKITVSMAEKKGIPVEVWYE